MVSLWQPLTYSFFSFQPPTPPKPTDPFSSLLAPLAVHAATGPSRWVGTGRVHRSKGADPAGLPEVPPYGAWHDHASGFGEVRLHDRLEDTVVDEERWANMIMDNHGVVVDGFCR